MTENDAEWIDVDREFAPPTRRPGPNRPPPRPRTTTFRPRVTSPAWPRGPRNGPPPRRRPTLRPRHDAPDRVPPSSNSTTTIAVSVTVSILVLVAIVVLLLYLFVLKKKLKKVQQSQSDSQYSLRVEDVSHLNIDDSAKLYVNTTDLQKLVSSVRIKNKKLPPPIPSPSDFPDVIQVGKPVVPLPVPTEKSEFVKINSGPNSNAQFSNTGYTDVMAEEGDEAIYANVREEINPPPLIVRPAPPLPRNCEKLVNKTGTSSKGPQEDDSAKVKSKPVPPVMPKPSTVPNRNESSPSATSIPNKSKPVAVTKPLISPPPPPKTSKPTSGALKPLLPRLKMNLIPTVNRQDSGFSTPDTAISYVSDATATPSDSAHHEPEMMSVKAKKAFLEGIIANETLRK